VGFPDARMLITMHITEQLNTTKCLVRSRCPTENSYCHYKLQYLDPSKTTTITIINTDVTHRPGSSRILVDSLSKK